MSVKERKVKKRGERRGDHRWGLRGARRGKGTTEEELQGQGKRWEGEPFAGAVGGRRTLQIPVNRIQLRCYREYRWRLFPSVHPIHNARPYDVDSRARTKGRGGSVCGRPYVLTTKPCDCFRMFQNTAPETRFSPTLLSDSLPLCFDPLLNVHLE